MIWGLSRLATSMMKRISGQEDMQFVFLFAIVAIAALVAQSTIDPTAFAKSVTTKFPLAISVVGALLLGKWIAAQAIGRLYGYSHDAKMTVWSLTLPQVAATLAATLVAYKTLNSAGKPLIDAQLFNVVFVLMLITSILGPVLTDRFAPRLARESLTMKEDKVSKLAS